MKHALILISALFQVCSAQFTLDLHYNLDLTQPTHDASAGMAPYSTWSNGPAFGAIFSVPLSSNLFLDFGLDRISRTFSHYEAPGGYGYIGTSPSFGGDGVVWKIDLGPTFREQIHGPFGCALHVGFLTTYQSYDDVYYYYNGFIDEDPYAPGEIAQKAPNPSSVYFGLTTKGSITYSISDSYGVLASVDASPNEVRGYYVQAAAGVFIGW